jgi:biotin carboxyl carrier protein
VKLHAAVTDSNVDVELRREGERVLACIDDREYELQLRQLGAGQFLLISNGQIFDCQVEGQSASGATLDVVVGTSRYAVTINDPKRLRGAESGAAHADGAARIIAPMPGKVVRVLVELGAQVESAAAIVVVEAMKMQNELKSPKAGTVTALNVTVGSTVNGGDVLAVIE